MKNSQGWISKETLSDCLDIYKADNERPITNELKHHTYKNKNKERKKLNFLKDTYKKSIKSSLNILF